jgi:multidrug efflux pump subunit AcrB
MSTPEIYYRRELGHFSKVLVFIAIAITGLAILPLLSIVPEDAEYTESIFIQVVWPGKDPETMASQLTSRIEAVAGMIDGITEISSVSDWGHATVKLKIKNKKDVQKVLLDLRTRLRPLKGMLPEGVLFPEVFTAGESDIQKSVLAEFVLFGKVPLALMSSMVDNVVLPNLRQVPGVERVEMSHLFKKYVEFRFDGKQVNAMGISPNAALLPLLFPGRYTSIGYLQSHKDDKYSQLVKLEVSGQGADVTIPDDWVVKTKDGKIVRVSDLFTLREYYDEKEGVYHYNGFPATRINVYGQKRLNSLVTGIYLDKIEKKLCEQLPEGLHLKRVNDPISRLRNDVRNLVVQWLASLLFLVLFLLIFMRDRTLSLVVFYSLVIALLFSMLMFYLLGMRLNLLSLAGITISLALISDSFVMKSSYLDPNHFFKGSPPLIAAAFTTVTAVAGLYFMEGKYAFVFVSMAGVLVVMILAALIVSVFFMPSLYFLMTGNKSSQYKENFTHELFSPISKYVHFLNKYKFIIILVLILLTGVPIYLLPQQMNKSAGWVANLYNSVFDNYRFREKIRPALENYLGGIPWYYYKNCIRKGARNSVEKPNELYLSFESSDDYGIEPFKHELANIEKLLQDFLPDINFESELQSSTTGHITIEAASERGKTLLPQIYDLLLQYSLNKKGLECWISLGKEGMVNKLGRIAGSYQIVLRGYSYKDLKYFSEKAYRLLSQKPRVQNIVVYSGITGSNNRMGVRNPLLVADPWLLSVSGMNYDKFSSWAGYKDQLYFPVNDMLVGLKDTSSPQATLWDLKNSVFELTDGVNYVPQVFTKQELMRQPPVYRFNQEYQLFIVFDIQIAPEIAFRIHKEMVKEINQTLPVGFRASLPDYSFMMKRGGEYSFGYVMVIVFLMYIFIYLIATGFLNSFRDGLPSLMFMPLATLGVLLIHAIYGIAFNVGTLAAIILIQGLVVNQLLFFQYTYKCLLISNSPFDALYMAFSDKIRHNTISTISVTLGLFPIIILTPKDSILGTFALGTVGGLLFSYLLFWITFNIWAAFVTPGANQKPEN